MRGVISGLVGGMCAVLVIVGEYVFGVDLTFAQRMIILT